MIVLDLTHQLDESTPIYADARGYTDPPTSLTTWIDLGDDLTSTSPGQPSPFRVTRLAMSLHTGTHVDAPAHFDSGGMELDALPTSALVGRAVVVDLSAAPVDAQPERLAAFRERASAADAAPLILMSSPGRLAMASVEEIAAWRRPLVCIFGAIDGGDPDCPATAALLRAGVFLAVDLAPTARQVRDGDLLVVAPLALEGVEGAPARVLAIRLSP